MWVLVALVASASDAVADNGAARTKAVGQTDWSKVLAYLCIFDPYGTMEGALSPAVCADGGDSREAALCARYCTMFDVPRATECSLCPRNDCTAFEDEADLELEFAFRLGPDRRISLVVESCRDLRVLAEQHGLTDAQCRAVQGEHTRGLCGQESWRDVCWDGNPVEELPREATVESEVIADAHGAVGMMNSCSGVLIEGNRFLTAGHCVSGGGQDTVFLGLNRTFDDILRWFALAQRNMYPVTGVLENEWNADSRLDYAIVSLGRNHLTGEFPADRFPSARIGTKNCPVGSGAAIITHRPSEQPSKTVDSGYITAVYETRVSTDLSGGPSSSGSPMFCEDGRIAGVYAGGGCARRGEGPHIEAILERSAILRNLAAGRSY